MVNNCELPKSVSQSKYILFFLWSVINLLFLLQCKTMFIHMFDIFQAHTRAQDSGH